jgi:glycosyltransferase involved in cell wall biosynthesis
MKAFCKAVQEDGLNAYIIFRTYYSEKADIDRILAIASAQGMLKRVRMIDEVPYERMPILYSMADFAVNFPAMDAFPVTFLECCACELPVLSNRLPAYASNGITKYLTFVNEDNECALSRRLVSMSNDGVDLSLMREARAHVARHFDESAFIAALVSAYGHLVEQRATR